MAQFMKRIPSKVAVFSVAMFLKGSDEIRIYQYDASAHMWECVPDTLSEKRGELVYSGKLMDMTFTQRMYLDCQLHGFRCIDGIYCFDILK